MPPPLRLIELHGLSVATAETVSLFVGCETEAELEQAYGKLKEGGAMLMPLDNYGFSTKFAWVNDRFGVSWQLNLK